MTRKKGYKEVRRTDHKLRRRKIPTFDIEASQQFTDEEIEEMEKADIEFQKKWDSYPDPFAYLEPPSKENPPPSSYRLTPKGHIPARRAIDKYLKEVDKRNFEEAERILRYWQNEAFQLVDPWGELAIVNEMLGFYRNMNNKTMCQFAVDRTKELISILGIEDGIQAAAININLATVYGAMGNCKLAIEVFDTAYQAILKFPKHLDLLPSLLNNKGAAYMELKMFEEAEECYKEALRRAEGTFDEFFDSPITHCNLAFLYYTIGEDEKAIFHLEEILFYFESGVQPLDVRYADTLLHCVPAFYNFGYDEEARKYEKIAHEIYDRL